MNYKKRNYTIYAFLVFGLCCFFAGWFIKDFGIKKVENEKLKTLRLSGYKYINPLLACDFESDENSQNLSTLKNKIENIITSHKENGDITSASVYYRDILSATSFEVNENTKYYPASLSKIPVMIAVFKIAKDNPEFLEKRIKWDDPTDYNASQGVKPSKYLEVGKTYSIMEAIEHMIIYSDNNAFYLLSKNIDVEIFKQTFSDLKISLREDPNSVQDFMTAKEFSYFLRVLYNATYINKVYSEKAMEMLSKVEYNQGILSGLPENVAVSHKFGYANVGDDNKQRELHDCGIVYKKDKPYLVCIMTKSESNLDKMQNVIADISSTFYTDS